MVRLLILLEGRYNWCKFHGKSNSNYRQYLRRWSYCIHYIGTTAEEIASNVTSTLKNVFAAGTATQSRIVVNEGSGSITITYPDESPSVSLISYSADTQVGINTTREVNQVVDTDIAFANSGNFLKAGELNLDVTPGPTLKIILLLARR